MLKKTVKYVVGLVALILIAYNSVYFKKLDEVKASSAKKFDAKSYARKYFDDKLIPALNNAVEIEQLLTMLKSDKENTFNKYSHALGIGNIKFFLIKGEGEITAINENDVTIVSKADSTQHVFTIATEFVYGNAIRDASGLIDLNEFSNTMDFNNVSEEINKIVRNEVLPSFKKTVKKGDIVQFFGAIELNKEHLSVENIETIPISLKIINNK